MKLSLRNRIILTLVPLLVLLAVLGATGAFLLYHLGGSIGLILRENYDSVIAMERLTEALERIDSSFQFALAGKEDKGREQFDRNWALYQRSLQTEQNNVTLPGERELVDQLTTLTDRYRREGEDFYTKQQDASVRQELYFGTADRRGLLSTFEQIKTTSGEISHINHENMVAASRSSRDLANQSLFWFALGLAAAVILAILLCYHTIRTILYPIQAMTEAARGITEGNLDQVVPHFSKDELGELAAAFNGMARHLRESRQSHTARLLRAQQTSQASIDSFPDPILVVDSEGHVEMANPAAQRVLGVAVSHAARRFLAGHTESGAITSDLVWQAPEPLRMPLASAIQEQRPYLPESFTQALSLRVDGHEHFMLPRILPVRDHHGNTLGAAVLLQDVTRFRLLDEIKSNLVATVSHELKTPLTSIQLDIHVLLDENVGPLTPKQIEFLMDARENADLLLARVNNLLDLTRLERGREQLDIRPEQPADLLRAAGDAIRPRADDKGVGVEIKVTPELPAVAADATRLQHALGNILENAVTYTDRGDRITLSAEPTDSGVQFSIADTGIGIPSEHIPNVFDRFFRVPGQSRGTSTGLGLAIAREIVAAHGGMIVCESQPGSGTVFRLTLPAWNAHPELVPSIGGDRGH